MGISQCFLLLFVIYVLLQLPGESNAESSFMNLIRRFLRRTSNTMDKKRTRKIQINQPIKKRNHSKPSALGLVNPVETYEPTEVTPIMRVLHEIDGASKKLVHKDIQLPLLEDLWHQLIERKNEKEHLKICGITYDDVYDFLNMNTELNLKIIPIYILKEKLIADQIFIQLLSVDWYWNEQKCADRFFDAMFGKFNEEFESARESGVRSPALLHLPIKIAVRYKMYSTGLQITLEEFTDKVNNGIVDTDMKIDMLPIVDEETYRDAIPHKTIVDIIAKMTPERRFYIFDDIQNYCSNDYIKSLKSETDTVKREEAEMYIKKMAAKMIFYAQHRMEAGNMATIACLERLKATNLLKGRNLDQLIGYLEDIRVGGRGRNLNEKLKSLGPLWKQFTTRVEMLRTTSKEIE